MQRHVRGARTAGFLQCTLPSRYPGPCLFCVPTSMVASCKRFLKPVAGRFCPRQFQNARGLYPINNGTSDRRGTLVLDSGSPVHAAFLKPVAKKDRPHSSLVGGGV